MVLVYLLNDQRLHYTITRKHNHFDASKKGLMKDVRYIYLFFGFFPDTEGRLVCELIRSKLPLINPSMD